LNYIPGQPGLRRGKHNKATVEPAPLG